MDDMLSTEELIDQLTSEAMAGRMVLLVGEDPEAVSERLGMAVERLIDFGVELTRFDALQFHSGETLLAELADVLGVDVEHVSVGLRVRGQTNNPLLLVVDNTECLSADAREVLRKLAQDTSGGLGVIFGGEPDAEAALLNACIPLALILETADQADAAPVAEDPEPLRAPRAAREPALGVTIPWRHLAAIVGLSLLVWLFWPTGENQDPVVVALPMPEPVAEVELEPVTAPPVAAEPEEVTPVHKSEPTPEPVLAPKPAPAPAPTSAPTPKPAPAPAPSRPALSGMQADLAYRSEDWLLAQPASRWVLQVAVATTEDAARSMLDQLGRERAAYYRARRDGRTVFVVLAGTWDSREQASAGRDRLASEFRARGPFPREMRAIHSEIMAVR